ncbi:MAG: sigma-54-dependent Fis family transcriptional regulator [Ignavibacteria bacterium]|jgi:DNA-binding NtrC family response regulator|nr:sigma-54-dependent Fis family transcriptional regulator [Ignavibacteria bacterium]MCU7503773.1 sigma-54-dependent Fis family transcriptional regulator [Ignavibacteria bacterium]MCU7517213.1 sigma-54-dependent Fis family transcriptional regulator [Ignavibacteria bacterium]
MKRNAKILITDDDETLCYLLKEELLNEGYSAEVVFDGKYAIDRIKNKNYDLLLLDLQMQEIHGEEVLDFVKEHAPNLQVIILSAETELRTAINCIKNGAYDFISKPYDFDHLLLTIDRALEHKDLVLKNTVLSSKVSQKSSSKIIGNSKQIQHTISLALRAARSDSNVLIEGETGTGKELMAEFIHQNSERNDKPFVIVNCASLPDQLIESELFGHEKGAFTDAKAPKPGLVEIADGGTLFLDEIGEMSLTLQPKLLRFLENGEYRRVGGVANLKSNVRVIGATNKNLIEESEKKVFRRDLLFRLNVITITIPPLRDRQEDTLLLADFFLQLKSPVRDPKSLSPEAKKALSGYSFPGNVRELQHTIERAVIFAEGNIIRPDDLNLPKAFQNNSQVQNFFEPDSEDILPLEEVERIHIKKALEFFDWNRENTAKGLGISQKTLYSKILKYQLRQQE